MFTKTKPKISHSSGTSIKKKAPPRPPPPSSTSIPRSASTGFDSWRSKSTPSIQRNQSVSSCNNITNRSDLIDLSSPSNSPPLTAPAFLESFPGATSSKVNDFKYHIGASIFYVKSELKSGGGGSSVPVANPFSPPRPSPQSLLTKAKPASTSISTAKQPTIIKTKVQPTTSLNNNNLSTTTNKIASIPLEWDEPPKKTHYPPPTVIRPIPPPKKPGLGQPKLMETNPNFGALDSAFRTAFVQAPTMQQQQPRYDEPPESDDDFDDFDVSADVPEPAEPPPPPPQDIDPFAVGQKYDSDAADRAYGIALYDYMSTETGDLQFCVGDVIYLIRLIDDSWLYGTCGSSEGMFPSNFINIVVPLSDGGSGTGGNYPESNSSNEIQSALSMNDIYTQSTTYPTHYVQALHDFDASEPYDLNIRGGDIVTVIGQVNEDWLYGELHGHKGQFPASFIEYVPNNLPFVDPKAQ